MTEKTTKNESLYKEQSNSNISEAKQDSNVVKKSNLIPLNERPKAEADAIRAKGVQASADKRFRTASLTEATKLILSLGADSEVAKTLIGEMNLPESTTNAVAAAAAVAKATIATGSAKGYIAMRDTIGEQPIARSQAVIFESTQTPEEVEKFFDKWGSDTESDLPEIEGDE